MQLHAAALVAVARLAHAVPAAVEVIQLLQEVAAHLLSMCCTDVLVDVHLLHENPIESY